jgi:hypothetical protein
MRRCVSLDKLLSLPACLPSYLPRAQFAELERSGLIDGPTFQQILEMDDDDEDKFSKQIVLDFFEQAEQTFEKMDKSL